MIGGFLGVRFAQGGADVSLVTRGAHLAAMRPHGVRLQIEGNEGGCACAMHRRSRHLRVDGERRLDGAAGLGAHKMSMLQDLERGRAMEIAPMVGAVQELGRLTGVATPAVDIVLALIRARARTARNAA